MYYYRIKQDAALNAMAMNMVGQTNPFALITNQQNTMVFEIFLCFLIILILLGDF